MTIVCRDHVYELKNDELTKIPLISSPSFEPRFQNILRRDIDCIVFYKHYILSYYNEFLILTDTKTSNYYTAEFTYGLE
jgi:hypothetical protein